MRATGRGGSAARGALGAVLPIAALAALLALAPDAAGATTFMTGRAVSDTGGRFAFLNVIVDDAFELQTTTAAQGLYLVDGLLPGIHDRLTILGGGLEPGVGPTFFAGATPAAGQDVLIVETSSLLRWADLLNDGTLDGDEDLDASLGIVFGEVRDALGATVAGATVQLAPASGDLFYFNESGDPDPTATATPSSGRFLVLNVDPGDCTVTSTAGAPLGTATLGRSYGRIIEGFVSGLSPAPLRSVAGTALDEAGAPVGSALIAWRFDPTVATTTGGGGFFALNELPDGLDLTFSGLASGFRPALTFSRLRADLDPFDLEVVLVSDASHAAWQAAFGIVQAPSLGMIFGRVRSANGLPAAGAIIVPDPAVGTIRYFDVTGAPDPGRTQTSASGLFAIFNIPVGDITLGAIAANAVIRPAAAPSAAGVVTSGELLGVPLVEFEGRVVDELFRTSTIGGAVVTIVEHPTLAAIVNSAGVFRFGAATANALPTGEPITFRIGRTGHKTSYSFMQTLTGDVLCTRATCTCPDEASDDFDPLCKTGGSFFLISETGYSNLFFQERVTPNRARGLVSAGVFFTNEEPAVGLEASLSPASANVKYTPDGKFNASQISTVGAVQFLNAAPIVSGFVLSDPRNTDATLLPIRIVADSVTLTDSARPACDVDLPLDPERNIYPCDGAQITKQAKDAFFQWSFGDFVKGKVQITTDPTFATCDGTAEGPCIKGDNRKKAFWRANPDTWKRVRNLGPTGTLVYWRVLLKDEDDNSTTTVPFVFTLP